MNKGIIYVMTTAVDGLIKIGKTSSDNFEKRMYNLEHNGYCNVAGLHRVFAIEVDEYTEKEIMLQTIFDKSRISGTELFALDKDIVIQLLSAFDGKVIYPEEVTKDTIFNNATDSNESKMIPDGVYTLKKKKKSDDNIVAVTAVVHNGEWTILKDSILGVAEDAGVSQKAREIRTKLKMDEQGKLLEDVKLGKCSPSHAGVIVMNQSSNGWIDWKNREGQSIEVYR